MPGNTALELDIGHWIDVDGMVVAIIKSITHESQKLFHLVHSVMKEPHCDLSLVRSRV